MVGFLSIKQRLWKETGLGEAPVTNARFPASRKSFSEINESGGEKFFRRERASSRGGIFLGTRPVDRLIITR